MTGLCLSLHTKTKMWRALLTAAARGPGGRQAARTAQELAGRTLPGFPLSSSRPLAGHSIAPLASSRGFAAGQPFASGVCVRARFASPRGVHGGKDAHCGAMGWAQVPGPRQHGLTHRAPSLFSHSQAAPSPTWTSRP